MNWLQEIAWEGATAAGCPPSWWLENKRLCMFGANRFDKEEPIRYQDRIIARTWISMMEGSRANREYDMRRASDGKVILRGQSETVMLDFPSRKLADWGEIADRFVPNNESFYNQYEPAAVTPPAEPVTFQATRLIQSDELEGIGEGISRWSFGMAVPGARREAKGEMTVRWWPEWTAALKPQAPAP